MAKEAAVESKNVAGAITSMGIDELVFNMAKGIADGQARLDETCMALAVQMGDAQIEFGKIPGTNEPDLISLIELGFTPNFYQFVDTILEVRVSVSSQYEEEQETTTSEVDQQINEKAKQEQYAIQKDNRYAASSYSYGGGYAVGWGRGGYGVGWAGSGANSAISGGDSESSRKNSTEKSKVVKVNTVDATFSSKYAYSVEASSLIKTKIVPVPPPQVFEEAVQSKAKERKEWAKRFALLRYSKSLLPAIADSSVESMDTINTYIASNADSPEFEMIEVVKIHFESLNEEYDKLMNDHWSVIENVKDRRILDNAFERLNKEATSLIAYYDETTKNLKVDADVDALNKELTASQIDLEKIKTKIDEIMKRLPLTPEEMADAEAIEDAND